MSRRYLRLFAFALLLNASYRALSQETYEVEILHADQAISQIYNAEQIKILVGHVRLKNKSQYIDCDSAVVYPSNNIDAFGHVVMKKSETRIKGDMLQYFSGQKIAVLNNNITLYHKKSVLTCQDLTYDMNHDIGYYMKGGRLVNDKTVITSQLGSLFTKTDLVLFRQNVVVKHPDYRLKSDSLEYNTKVKRTQFKTSTMLENDSGYVLCHTGWYDEDSKQSSFGKNTLIYNPPSWIVTDSIWTDRISGQSRIFKTFEYHDTAAKMHIFGDSAYLYQNNKYITAYKRPLLIIENDQNQNPTFTRGNTLYSQPAAHPKKGRELRAIGLVKMYNSEFQSRADTMLYFETDSMMHLHGNPILWYDQSQISGSSIHILMRDKKPNMMYVYQQAFLAQDESLKIHFNQISADSIRVLFKLGKIDQLFAYSEAQSIYYGKEEGKGYLGFNKSQSYSLKAFFDSSKAKKIVFYQEPKATFIPTKEITTENRYLKGFKWQEAIKPKSREDL